MSGNSFWKFLVAAIAVRAWDNAAGQCPPIYVFDGQWPGDFLGAAAGVGDVDGDGYDDLTLGAPGYDAGISTNIGKVYVRSGRDGHLLWSVLGEPFPSWDETGFGAQVAGPGDVDADGHADVLVSAIIYHGSAGDQAGKVYLYSGASGELLRSWDGHIQDEFFGLSIAGVGDVDGDKVPDIVIGAPGFGAPDNGFPGKAYVYSGATGGEIWSWSGKTEGDQFGLSVDGAGDFDGDGISDVIVGAPWADEVELSDGTASIYSGRTGQLLWMGQGEQFSEEFGRSVSGVGDVDGNGFDDIAVGAFRHNGPEGEPSDYGRAYVFGGPDGRLLWTWDGEAWNDFFGWVVDGVGDIDGDQVPDVVIGAYGHSPPEGFANGRAYVYSGRTGEPLWAWDGEHPLDFFGTYASGVGDLDGDGRSEVVIATDWYGYDRGRAYIFKPVIPAECNCATTLSDFQGVFACMPKTTEGADKCVCSDFDGDGDTDLRDLARFQVLFGRDQ